jgi:pimeloyl-ACP methyl ester carboxylesterase
MRRVALATALALFAPPSPSAPVTARAVHFTACQIGEKLIGHCGTVDVYENRLLRSGRTLALAVTEIDAVHRSGRAVFWNPGGPGGADSRFLPAIASGAFAKELIKLHETYDLVFVDNRGTGDSGALDCKNFYSALHPERFFAQLYPDAEVRRCRDAQSKVADLNMYTTDISADDLDDIRAALHYPKIVLDGVSYGTTFFLDYARRHPTHVESLVLSGVAPPGFMLIPLEDAQGAQTAMNAVIAGCSHDATCSEHYPHFGADFATLVRRFNAGPVKILVRNYMTGRQQTVLLSRETFADQLRSTLFRNDRAAYIPYIVAQAHRGNYGPVAELVEVAARSIAGGTAMGLNLSVTCAEDVPFIVEAQIVQSSAGSFEGDTRVRAEQRACKIWNVRQASPSFVQPVRSIGPVLIISGSDDPATPPSYGREALSYLPNGRQIVIPHTSHEIESPCVDALIVAFVHAHDARRLNASTCVGSFGRLPFAYSMKGFDG